MAAVGQVTQLRSSSRGCRSAPTRATSATSSRASRWWARTCSWTRTVVPPAWCASPRHHTDASCSLPCGLQTSPVIPAEGGPSHHRRCYVGQGGRLVRRRPTHRVPHRGQQQPVQRRPRARSRQLMIGLARATAPTAVEGVWGARTRRGTRIRPGCCNCRRLQHAARVRINAPHPRFLRRALAPAPTDAR